MAFLIKPLHDRLLVRISDKQEDKKGSIFIPQSAQERPQEGTVMAVGAGKVLDNGELRAPVVAIGDRILFGKYSGGKILIADEEYLVMREDEVLAVLAEQVQAAS